MLFIILLKYIKCLNEYKNKCFNKEIFTKLKSIVNLKKKTKKHHIDFLPPEQFQFTSQRHLGFPFSATIFVNGIMAARISSCCEYRYAPGFQQGRRSCFRLTRLNGGKPCYKWDMMACKIKKRFKARPNRLPPLTFSPFTDVWIQGTVSAPQRSIVQLQPWQEPSSLMKVGLNATAIRFFSLAFFKMIQGTLFTECLTVIMPSVQVLWNRALLPLCLSLLEWKDLCRRPASSQKMEVLCQLTVKTWMAAWKKEGITNVIKDHAASGERAKVWRNRNHIKTEMNLKTIQLPTPTNNCKHQQKNMWKAKRTQWLKIKWKCQVSTNLFQQCGSPLFIVPVRGQGRWIELLASTL